MLSKIEMQVMDAIIGIHREMKKQKEINWEERRYEIAKAIYPTALSESIVLSGNTEKAAKAAVEMAQDLIDELKKNSEHE